MLFVFVQLRSLDFCGLWNGALLCWRFTCLILSVCGEDTSLYLDLRIYRYSLSHILTSILNVHIVVDFEAKKIGKDMRLVNFYGHYGK